MISGLPANAVSYRQSCHASGGGAIGLDAGMPICHTPAAMKRLIFGHSGPQRPRRFSRRLLPWPAILICLATIGCASRDKGFDDEFAGTAKQLRSKKTGGQQMGLSARSRQIESDLGVE
jgi:hypothetical protein